MKKVLLLTGVAALLLCSACTKEKNCRCSVLGRQNVRIVTIKGGSCSQLNYASYQDELDTTHIDKMLCTDYPFDADSLIIEQ